MFPKTGPIWKQAPISRALLSISFCAPSKGAFSPGSPHRAPTERDAPFPQPSFIRLATSPVHEPLSGSPAGPQWREMPVSRAFLYISFRVPSTGAPLQVPLTEFHWERCSVSRALQLYFTVPGKWNPPRFPNGAPTREMPVSGAFAYSSPW